MIEGKNLGRDCHCLKPWARIALGAAALAAASGLHAAGLFLPVGGAGDVAPAVRSAPAGRDAPVVRDAWERRVRIDRDELTAALRDVENAGAGGLLLNVGAGVRLDVVVERAAPTRFGYSLSGHVAGGSASVGFVTLVVHEEAVAGSIWTPDAAYELNYLGGGVHALRDVTNAPPVECAGGLPSELSATDATAQQGGVDDGSVVDILVVWTPEAEEHAGGESQVKSRIDMLVSFTNDAFERSGAFVSLNLVGAEKVEYIEVDSVTDLDRLEDTDDGHMDSVHDRRNALGADLISLLTRRAGGRANTPGEFSVSGQFNSTFAHEIGHNFGIGHERAEAGPAGYYHGFTTAGCHRTIMSYGVLSGGNCWRSRVRMPLYASPWRYSPRGRALGVTRFSKERGVFGPADAVLTLNRNRHRAANYR